MIADTAITTGSPWLSDSPDCDDLSSFDLDIDINAFEAEISRLHRQSDAQQDMYAFLTSASRDTSVAGSECSDDLYVDGDDTLFCDLQASILNIIDDNSDTNILSLDNMDLADSDWGFSQCSNDFDNQSVTSDYSSASSSSKSCNSSASSTISCSSSSSNKESKSLTVCKSVDSKTISKNLSKEESTHNTESSPLTGRKRQNSQSPDGKKWSHLSSNEQVSVVEELSQVISSEMGLREQLEVIRIINPSANVSPTDREFVIDLETLDDSKLQKIQEYIKLHVKSCSSQDMCSDCPNPTQKRTTKRQKCQERRSQQKELRQRQRKEYRQMMKERRSGLFVKEEVLALSTTTDPGEEDIDILM